MIVLTIPFGRNPTIFIYAIELKPCVGILNPIASKTSSSTLVESKTVLPFSSVVRKSLISNKFPLLSLKLKGTTISAGSQFPFSSFLIFCKWSFRSPEI